MAAGISFIIPVFNGEDTLGDCLKSILDQQGLEQFEVIVVDNMSNDRSVAIASSFANVKVVSCPQIGRASSRNAGAALSCFPMLAFVDCDVLLPKLWASTLQRALVPPFSFGQTEIEIEFTSKITKLFTPRSARHFLFGESARVTIDSAAMMIHRFAYDEVGGFDTTRLRWEDTDLTIKMLELGHSALVLHGPAPRKIENRGIFSRVLRAIQIGRSEYMYWGETVQLFPLTFSSVLLTHMKYQNFMFTLHALGAWTVRALPIPRVRRGSGWRGCFGGGALHKSLVILATGEFITLRSTNCQFSVTIPSTDERFIQVYSLIFTGRPMFSSFYMAIKPHLSLEMRNRVLIQ